MKRTFLSLLFLSSTTLFCSCYTPNKSKEPILTEEQQRRARELQKTRGPNNVHCNTLKILNRQDTEANRMEIAVTRSLYNGNINDPSAPGLIAEIYRKLSRYHPVFFALMQNYAENFKNTNRTSFTVEDPDNKSQFTITRQKNGTVTAENESKLDQFKKSLALRLTIMFRDEKKAKAITQHVTQGITEIHWTKQ